MAPTIRRRHVLVAATVLVIAGTIALGSLGDGGGAPTDGGATTDGPDPPDANETTTDASDDPGETPTDEPDGTTGTTGPGETPTDGPDGTTGTTDPGSTTGPTTTTSTSTPISTTSTPTSSPTPTPMPTPTPTPRPPEPSNTVPVDPPGSAAYHRFAADERYAYIGADRDRLLAWEIAEFTSDPRNERERATADAFPGSEFFTVVVTDRNRAAGTRVTRQLRGSQRATETDAFDAAAGDPVSRPFYVLYLGLLVTDPLTAEERATAAPERRGRALRTNNSWEVTRADLPPGATATVPWERARVDVLGTASHADVECTEIVVVPLNRAGTVDPDAERATFCVDRAYPFAVAASGGGEAVPDLRLIDVERPDE